MKSPVYFPLHGTLKFLLLLSSTSKTLEVFSITTVRGLLQILAPTRSSPIGKFFSTFVSFFHQVVYYRFIIVGFLAFWLCQWCHPFSGAPIRIGLLGILKAFGLENFRISFFTEYRACSFSPSALGDIPLQSAWSVGFFQFFEVWFVNCDLIVLPFFVDVWFCSRELRSKALQPHHRRRRYLELRRLPRDRDA